MRKTYDRALKLIGLLILVCTLVGIAYLFYDKVKEQQTIVEANGELSINYINGKVIDKNGTYEFSVTNNSEKDFYYEIAITELKNLDADLKYSLTSSDANINMTNISLEGDRLLLADNILIKKRATQNFHLTIANNISTSFKLSINKNNDTEEYFFATILKNNEAKKSTITKPVVNIATSDEGLIEDIDDYGITYYFRGKVTNNYVRFADKLWRIVRINGDGTVRLVLNSAVEELSSYHNEVGKIEEYEKTEVNKNLQAYYENYLKSYDNFIANTKFCEDDSSTEKDGDKIYNAYTRLVTNGIPTFNCLGEKYSSKIGLLSVDEVAFAGANFEEDNKEYYLYNDKIENIWWTSSLAKTKGESFYPFAITGNGKIEDATSGILFRNVRPVINLIKKVTVSGDGTINNPYVIDN